MLFLKRLMVVACFFLATKTSVASVIDQNRLLTLSQSPTWKKLMHYEESDTDTGLLSAIHSDEFFLSSEGIKDSFAELKATIDELQKVTNSDVNSHAQCKFPARFIFLSKELPEWAEGIEKLSCPEYEQWHFDYTTDSISIVFANGYLGNPASFYGHTLLKLNSSKNRSTVPLIDVSVNYGAVVPDGENPVSYIIKGMMGGYKGGFSHIEYYYHTHNYGETELRDLWEYELDLSKDEVRFILAHTWEVLGKEYTYYFFRKNCSYRMAELIEILPDLEIIPQNPMYGCLRF